MKEIFFPLLAAFILGLALGAGGNRKQLEAEGWVNPHLQKEIEDSIKREISKQQIIQLNENKDSLLEVIRTTNDLSILDSILIDASRHFH